MIIIKGPTAYCDVDDTLVSWKTYPKRGKNSVEFIDPYDNSALYLNVIHEHVEALKLHKLRGHNVVVWSAGGGEWAEVVVKKLQLESYVDLCIDKPHWFYDDLPASQFMPEISRKYYLKGNVGDNE